MPNSELGKGRGMYRADIGKVGHIEKFSTKDDGSKPVSFDVVKRMAQIKKKRKGK